MHHDLGETATLRAFDTPCKQGPSLPYYRFDILLASCPVEGSPVRQWMVFLLLLAEAGAKRKEDSVLAGQPFEMASP